MIKEMRTRPDTQEQPENGRYIHQFSISSKASALVLRHSLSREKT